MGKQYGTSNGHSKWTYLVYCNTDRTSEPQAGASEHRAGGKQNCPRSPMKPGNEGNMVKG